MKKTTKSKPVVLVVDDEADIRLFYRHALRGSFEIVEAGTAEEALRMFVGKAPAAVVADLSLPGMSGVQMIERMRRLRAHVPILVCSAGGASRDQLEALAAGADDFLVKPFEPHELRLRLLRLLGEADR